MQDGRLVLVKSVLISTSFSSSAALCQLWKLLFLSWVATSFSALKLGYSSIKQLTAASAPGTACFNEVVMGRRVRQVLIKTEYSD